MSRPLECQALGLPRFSAFQRLLFPGSSEERITVGFHFERKGNRSMTTSWKQWLTEAESNSRGIGKSAYLTALAVRELWKSRDFLKEACGGVLDDMSSKLSKFSGRFALGLNDMLHMIDHFPNEKDWVGARLDSLREETCRLILAKNGKDKKQDEGARRHVISQAKYKALERKYRTLQARYRKLEADYNRLLRGKKQARSV